MTFGPLVYIDTRQNYYARWENRIRTHAYETMEPLTQYWVEVIRVDPALIDKQV